MNDLKFGSLFKCAGASVLALVLAGCGNGNSPSSTLALGPSVLSGSYVFTATGTDASDGDYSVVGSFVADGKGNITSGVADYNLGSGVDDNVALSGTYTVSAGSILVTLMDGGVVKDTFTTAPLNAGTAGVANFDGTGSGTLYAQVTSGFTPTGTYSFSLKGEGDGIVSGSGQFVAASSGAFTSGSLTFSNGQSALSYTTVTGLLGPTNSGGRGYANIQGNDLAYYVVGPNQIQMMGLDARFLLTIPAQKM